MISIPEAIGKVVESLRPVGSDAPYYMHGHPTEISALLNQKTESSTWKFKKYPVIILFQDFDENVNGEMVQASLNIAICTDSKESYEAGQRYQNTFKNTLTPLYESFMNALKKSAYVSMNGSGFEHTKTDRLFWGRNSSDVLPDAIDAIEINNLNLTFIRC